MYNLHEFEKAIAKGKSLARRKLYFMSLILILVSVIVWFRVYKISEIILLVLITEIYLLIPFCFYISFKNEKEFKSIPDYIIADFVNNLEFVDSSKRVARGTYGLVVMNAFTFKIILYSNILDNKCEVHRNPIINITGILYKTSTNKFTKTINYNWFEKSYLYEIINKELENYEPINNEHCVYLDIPRGKKRYYDYNDKKTILN